MPFASSRFFFLLIQGLLGLRHKLIRAILFFGELIYFCKAFPLEAIYYPPAIA